MERQANLSSTTDHASHAPRRLRRLPGASYTYAGGVHRLTVTLEAPDDAPLDALLDAPVHLALVVEGPALVVLVRLDGMASWEPAAFSWHLLSPAERVAPAWPLADGAGTSLELTLIRATTGATVGSRHLGLSHPFASMLHAAIHRQSRDSAVTRAAFERAVNALTARYMGAGLVKQAVARATIPAVRRRDDHAP